MLSASSCMHAPQIATRHKCFTTVLKTYHKSCADVTYTQTQELNNTPEAASWSKCNHKKLFSTCSQDFSQCRRARFGHLPNIKCTQHLHSQCDSRKQGATPSSARIKQAASAVGTMAQTWPGMHGNTNWGKLILQPIRRQRNMRATETITWLIG